MALKRTELIKIGREILLVVGIVHVFQRCFLSYRINGMIRPAT